MTMFEEALAAARITMSMPSAQLVCSFRSWHDEDAKTSVDDFAQQFVFGGQALTPTSRCRGILQLPSFRRLRRVPSPPSETIGCCGVAGHRHQSLRHSLQGPMGVV